LTRGRQPAPAGPADTPPVEFPTIPDRWLVVRLEPGAGAATRTIRGWVLEAGGKEAKAFDLDGWTEPGPLAPGGPNTPVKPLSALGHGDPAWAAYYDNVENRLGFYDDLSDVEAGPVAYLVCGWFAPPGDGDPLADAKVRSLADFHSRMSELRWQLATGELQEAVRHIDVHVSAARAAGLDVRTRLDYEADAVPAPQPAPGALRLESRHQPLLENAASHVVLDRGDHQAYVTDGSWWPKQTLYHGTAVGIGWPEDAWPGNENGALSTEEGGPPSPDSLVVALGSTLSETLGAVVARTNGQPDEARVLEAFQLGALRELDRPDGRPRLDAVLHASAFGSVAGGPETTERIRKPASGRDPSPSPAPVPGPGVFAHRPKPPFDRFETIDATMVTTARGTVEAVTFESPARRAESTIIEGRLSDAFIHLGIEPAFDDDFRPASEIDVARSQPRLFYPHDPVLLVQGARRTFKHGGDDRFTAESMLTCRLSGFCVTELAPRWVGDDPRRFGVSGDDVLARGLGNGSIPSDCEDLLREAVLLDPGSSSAITAASQRHRAFGSVTLANASSSVLVAQQSRVLVEQTAWWSLRNPHVDAGTIAAHSAYRGMLPAAIAVTPPQRPWNPVHLEWRLAWTPNTFDDWQLDEIDYDATGGAPAQDGRGAVVIEGRSTLTGGAAATVASAARAALENATRSGSASTTKVSLKPRFASVVAQSMLAKAQTALQRAFDTRAGDGGGDGGGIPAADVPVLQTIVSLLEGMDVLAGGVEGFHDELRKHVPSIRSDEETGELARPDGFTALRAGHFRVLRLRLVDGFGQYLELAGSDAEHDVDPQKLIVAETIDVADEPGLAALPPRFTAPARLLLRFAGAGDDATEGEIDPVCGFLMPDHLDGACTFFDAAGGGLGSMRSTDDEALAWEDEPGTPSTVGQDPARAVPNAHLAGIAQGLLDWGVANALEPAERDDALQALLRVIDSTLWSVDPFAHTGDEHLALLVGHPAVVLRAVLRLEVQDPANPPENRMTPVPVRLGALEHWQDGLLGFFVDDDYTKLHCAQSAARMAREVGPGRGYLQAAADVQAFHDAFGNDLPDGATAGTTPVTHPYVDPDALIYIRPGQEVKLTLLVEPQAVVHATTGLLPRKEIGVRREWIADALAKLSPTFRFGPVLVDPKTVRMPVASEIAGSWSWDHRQQVVDWVEDPVVNATQDALLDDRPSRASEGWLRLGPPPEGGSA
jgi:hypothetical protein